MAEIPVTSQTLLRDIAGDSQSVRWSEFVGRYRPMMEAYVHEYFPYLETDDLVQETLIALVEKLPTYKYNPKETGHFRNYLTGILKRKALRVCSQNKRRGEVMAYYRLEPRKDSDNPREVSEAEEEKAWRESVYEIALQQLMADDGVQARTKQVFVRTAIKGERPDEVADSFGITRNAVDQMKNRMLEKLRDIVSQLENVDGVNC